GSGCQSRFLAGEVYFYSACSQRKPLLKICPRGRGAAAGWSQNVNRAVAPSVVTASHEDCEGAARNRNMPRPRTAGICDCELALWIVGRDHWRGPGGGVVGFAHHSSPSLRKGSL